MIYEEIEITDLSGTQTHIIVDNGDGNFTSFPAIEGNPAYDAFVEALAAEKPKTK